MSSNDQMLYNLQKFKIMSLFTSDSALRKVSAAYAFAWEHDIYPVLSDSTPWHQPYDQCFKVGKERMQELADFLDTLDREGKTISFYDLESRYGTKFPGGSGQRSVHTWDRMELVFACRYFKLSGIFEDAFWKGLVGHSDCPIESHSVMRDFGVEDVTFQ